MLSVLRHRTYRRLFGAQAIALVGTGLATVALSLLAFELAGQSAGLVLGTALAIKMVAYVGIAPVATAVAQRLPRRQLLVALDLVRAAVALSLPFVTQIWQIYALIFLLQAASASFTPTFQATIPDVLPDEQEYTKALSLSRMAYDLESLLSPMLAAALLGVMSFHALFAGTVLGFLASALLVASVTLPGPAAAERRGFYDRTTRGLRIYLATPRLRGLLAINFGLAAAGAMVFVNTVVLLQAQWGLPQNALALALASFGAGSMVAALGLPRLLERWPDRPVMLTGTAALCVLMVAGIWLTSYPPLLLLWFMVGVAYAIAQTPSGRLLRRSAHPTDRPALFAAQFALSHACWLLFYPLAGWAGAHWGLSATFGVLGAAVLLALCVAWRLWPAEDPEVIEHHHEDGTRHAHAYWIDDQHPHWPASRSRPSP
ncbi:MFS transporter [Hydrogenophaga borbori]|uniref:MFS transporter n=1 Tax=Hydrogenophaga borbori TaxID=2294117 RepID=UPI00301B7CF0